MANLPETPTFDSVYQIERQDTVDAGENGQGIANRQAQQLANRTKYLKEELANLANIARTGNYDDLEGKPDLRSAAGEDIEFFIAAAEKGAAGGVATLDSNGKLTAAQRPAGGGGGSDFDPSEIIDTEELSDSDDKVPSSKLLAAILANLPSGGGSDDTFEELNFDYVTFNEGGDPEQLYAEFSPSALPDATKAYRGYLYNYYGGPDFGYVGEGVAVRYEYYPRSEHIFIESENMHFHLFSATLAINFGSLGQISRNTVFFQEDGNPIDVSSISDESWYENTTHHQINVNLSDLGFPQDGKTYGVRNGSPYEVVSGGAWYSETVTEESGANGNDNIVTFDILKTANKLEIVLGTSPFATFQYLNDSNKGELEFRTNYEMPTTQMGRYSLVGQWINIRPETQVQLTTISNKLVIKARAVGIGAWLYNRLSLKNNPIVINFYHF